MAIDSLTVTQALDSLTVSANDGANSLLTGGTISGNFQIDGTLTTGVNDTGYDVKFFGDAASKFMHWDASADELKLPDSTKLIFGTGGDLKIYHESGNNWITCPVGGNLMIQSNGLALRSMAQDNYINCTSDGAVDLYYNNSKKFETTNTGATISGKLVVNGDLEVSTSGTITHFQSTTTQIDDPVLRLGENAANDNFDRGVEFLYNDGSAKVGFFGYSDSLEAFTFLTAATNNSEVFTGIAGTLHVGSVLHEAGSAGTPAISFSSDTNTGFYYAGTDSIGISTNGTYRAKFTSSGLFETWAGIQLKGGVIRTTDGDASAPSYSFQSDTDTGFYYSSNTLYASFAGSAAWLFKADYIGSASSFAAMVTKAAGSAAAPSYSFMSDTDTGIFRVAADQLGISTGGTERVHVYNDGFDFNNVSVNFKDSGGDGRATLGLASQHFNINVYGTSGWLNNVLNIDNDTGHVGIGTTTPSTTLHIKSADPVIRLEDSAPDGIYGSIDGAGGSLILDADKGAGAAGSNIQFRVDNSEAMRVIAGGNVGIGCSNPTTPLEVWGQWIKLRAGGTDAELVLSAADSTTNNSIIKFGDNDNSNIGQIQYAHDGDSMRFITNTSEAMRIDSTGNVGIGTTAPSHALNVAVSSSDDGIVLQKAGSSNDLFKFSMDGTNDKAELFQYSQGTCIFAVRPTNVGYINTGQNFGIGTTSPQKALDISGVSSSGGGVLRLSGTGESSQNDVTGAIQFFNGDTTDNTAGVFGIIRGVAGASGGEGSLQILTDMPSEGADASTVAMHISSSAQIGIGTTAPSAKVHINGPSSGFSEILRLQRDGGNYYSIGLDNNDLNFCYNGQSSDGSALVIDGATSRIGIGTKAPSSLLEVRGAAGAAGILTLSTAELTVVDGDELGRINFSAPLESSGTDAILVAASIYAEADDTFDASTNDTDLVFATGLSETATEKMRLDSSGKLGIGCIPTANLDITTSLNQQHLYIQGALDSGNTALARLKTISSGNVLLLESATTSDSREIFDVKNSNGTVFKIQGDGMSVFSKGLTTSITTVNNTDYTLATTDHIIIFTNLSAGRTLTLQTAQAVAGRMVIVKEKDGYASSYNITIATEGSETIDGNNTATLSTDKGTIRLTSDGTNWLII
jgi:hypothetical protein